MLLYHLIKSFPDAHPVIKLTVYVVVTVIGITVLIIGKQKNLY